MSTINRPSDSSSNATSLPGSLREQLIAFRDHVRRSKMLEVFGLAVIGLTLGFFAVFIADRWFDTSQTARFVIWLAVVAGWMMLPWAFHRWVWSYRKLEQLAGLIRRRAPSLGDELLGVIELSANRNEQNRSPALCAAAIQQVAARTAQRNLLDFAPNSRHILGLRIAFGAIVVALALLAIVPSAAWNAMVRMTMPWRSVERYTFTQLESLPASLVVPHGETFNLEPTLASKTEWSPAQASAKLAYQPLQQVRRIENRYPLAFEPLNSTASLDLRIGDYTHRMKIEPKLRPELNGMQANIRLPEYLQQTATQRRDIRGGSLSVVAGSQVVIDAEFNRDLASATVNDQPLLPSSSITTQRPTSPSPLLGERGPGGEGLTTSTFSTPSISVPEATTTLAFNWTDKDNLSAKQPFRVSIEGLPDAAPMISAEGLPRNAIVLNTEQLNFQIIANDDFGVQQVGMEWAGESIEEKLKREPTALAAGSSDSSLQTEAVPGSSSRFLSSGAPDKTSLLCQGTFRPIDWGIESQTIELKAWAVDYLPNRERAYSSVYRLLVLRPDEHAVWVTEQLNQWHRQSLDVRDRELQLYEANRELRELSPAALAAPENRKRLEEQAAAESSNERRLRGLVGSGEALLKQAARNPEFGVGHLERWAEMLKVLQGIGNQRMPKVSDLLRQAAREATAGASPSKPTGPAAGQIRDTSSASANSNAPPPESESQSKPMPKLVDRESTMQPAGKALPNDAPPPKQAGGSKFTLPQTTLMGPPQKPSDANKPENEEGSKVEAAVREQEALLAEFDRLADELSQILGDLEGSTLVKRLKAASREQLHVAQEITKRLENLLAAKKIPYHSEPNDGLNDLAETEAKGSGKVSNIMDDLEAFQERRRLAKFQKIFDEMKASQVVGALRQLGEELPKEHGMSIAQAEYWADTLDRWAEDLVDPACKGNCPGCKTTDSLPPSVVLEVLQILEGQVNLREETRVVEQARRPDAEEAHRQDAAKLAKRQQELDDRVVAVVDKIRNLPPLEPVATDPSSPGKPAAELPTPEQRFADELQRLNQADELMTESVNTFEKPETGKSSIAVQTEIIELLLQSKRINPKSGGGGGATPGGGGKGDTTDAAIALVGSGLDLKAVKEERETVQSTGQTGSNFPEEFRDGLNQYFQRLESRTINKPSAP